MKTREHSNTIKSVLLLVAGMGFASAASASLESRPGGMVFDTDFNITWLADSNLAATNTFEVVGISASGTMTWDVAQSWIAAMNTADYLGYNNWRLPTALNPDGSGPNFGFGAAGSELGHLFYQELGAAINSSILNGNPTELAKFSNVQPYVFWSGTGYATDNNLAWNFDTNTGGQYVGGKVSGFNAWAIRTGDVAAVPLPAAVWLFGSALTGLTLLGARRGRG